MGSRADLHTLLKGILESNNVYFQPPPSLQMAYPCIVYKRDSSPSVMYSDNQKYKHKRRYQVTVIDANPDTELVAKVEEIPFCSYERFFTADNLNHDVFNLFF